MRIAVDMHFLQDKHQGIRTCLTGLYGAVCRMNTRHEFAFVFLHPDKESEYWRQYGQVVFTGGQGRMRRLAHGMANAIRQLGQVDLSHFSAVVPAFVPGKVLVTIHDILFLTHPEYFPWQYRCKQRLALQWTLRRADAITVVSEYTRGAVEGISRKRPVELLPNGIDKELLSGIKSDSREFVRSRYGLDRYFLTVGRIDPRKNHANMLKAFDLLRQKVAPDVLPVFVIVGDVDNEYVEGMNLINGASEKLPVVWLRDVDNEALHHLYRAALCTVMASYAEGFGLPVLESMATRTPVIAADNTAIPEVLGDGGLLVDAREPSAIADAYMKMFEDAKLRESCARDGYRRASTMTWERCAECYLALLEEL